MRGGVWIANVTISSDNLWTKWLCTRPLDVILVWFHLILTNMALKIITASDCNATFTISRGELIPICPGYIPFTSCAIILSYSGKYSVGNHNVRCLHSYRYDIQWKPVDPNVYVHFLWRYISLILSNSWKYGPGNHKGRWVQCQRYDIQGRIDTHMSLHTSHSNLVLKYWPYSGKYRAANHKGRGLVS